MKKIFALLLAVVMTLCLMTVAFAGTTNTSYGNTNTKLTGDWYVVADGKKVDGIEITGATEISVREVIDTKTTKTYIPAFYTATGLNEDEVLYDCVKDCADYGLYHDGKFVCYVNVDYAPEILGFLSEAVFVAGTNSGKCGTFATDVYVIDGKAYEAVSHGGDKAVFNGKFMQYANEQFAVEHKFEMTNVTYKGTKGDEAKTPVSVKCSKCGNSFSIVSSIPKDYLGEVNTDFYTGYYVLLGNKTVFEDTTTEVVKDTKDTSVNSAKTFDAGIASYVCASVMSVFGGAVVVNKKKNIVK